MKRIVCAFAVAPLICAATYETPHAATIADWQYPWQLPPRFRNHCAYEYFTARPYCSNHCGSDYQFYYCSELSFGCCHLGRGYCDWNGLFRPLAASPIRSDAWATISSTTLADF
jgi:hypothetical protein